MHTTTEAKMRQDLIRDYLLRDDFRGAFALWYKMGEYDSIAQMASKQLTSTNADLLHYRMMVRWMDKIGRKFSDERLVDVVVTMFARRRFDYMFHVFKDLPRECQIEAIEGMADPPLLRCAQFGQRRFEMMDTCANLVEGEEAYARIVSKLEGESWARWWITWYREKALGIHRRMVPA